ncbi:MAG: Ig-like domain-containing protein [candidate division Zixibacteria bacterium]|nr:Ig-like domain-containing protein [candidate division Zixibacteria bacterium]
MANSPLLCTSRVVLAGLLLASCAKIGTPEGGPPDTVPPEIVRSVPASGAVNAPRSAALTLEFSESVDQNTFTSDMTVSPPLAGKPEVKWSGRIANMRWADTLRAGVTYRFSFGSKLSDLHSNRLKEPITIAFSTGDKIDSCRIKGEAWTPEAVASGVSILVYQLDSARTWPRDEPDFVSQSGITGQFDVPYLPPGDYRLIAVGDKNRNGHPDQTELFGMATADVDLRTRTTADGIHLFVSPLDTTAFKLDGCSQTADGSLLVGLTHAADTSVWAKAAFVVIDSASRETLSVTALRPVPPKFTTVPILSDQFVVGRTYEVISGTGPADSACVIHDDGGHSLGVDSCFVTWVPMVDTVGPKVNWTVLPIVAIATSAATPFQIGFNEPVDTVASHDVLVVRDSLGHDLPGVLRWLDSRHLTFTPVPTWPDSVILVIASLDSTKLFDRRHNLAPPQPHSWKFRPVLRSQIGTLSGTIELADPAWAAVPCYLEARPTTKGTNVIRYFDRPGLFEMNLPAGRWILGGYLDLDRNGRWSRGNIQPFAAAEPRTIPRDTITVRARGTGRMQYAPTVG